MKTKWNDLIVTDSEGGCGETLGAIVANSPGNLTSATIEDGKISSWPDFLLSADGEEPDYDTPKSEVDWAGFEDTLGQYDH